MEPEDVYYNDTDYIETTAGNKVSKNTVLCGSQNIVLLGKTIIQTQCVIRGDLAEIKIGRNCIISANSVVRPPFKVFLKGVAFLPVVIGNHVFIGEDSIVNAGAIGSHVYIGKNCVIGQHCVLKECCAIADNTHLPQGTVVSPFSIYAGVPGTRVGELPECAQRIMAEYTLNYYRHFKPKPTKREIKSRD